MNLICIPYQLLAFGFLLIQTGCVGISLVTGTKQVELSKNIGQQVGDYGNNETGITSADVLTRWGQPDTKTVTNFGERWTYVADNRSWRGLQLWIIVPVPLLIPTGYHKVNLEFIDGVLTKYTVDNAREKFFGYFLMNGTTRVWQLNTEEATSGIHGYYGHY